MDYGLQTYFLGRILYPRIWNAGSRRCEIQYDRIDHYYVALPCEPVYLSVRALHFGPMAVWIGMFTDWGVRSIIFFGRFHSRKWLEHRVVA